MRAIMELNNYYRGLYFGFYVHIKYNVVVAKISSSMSKQAYSSPPPMRGRSLLLAVAKCPTKWRYSLSNLSNDYFSSNRQMNTVAKTVAAWIKECPL